MAQWQIIEGDCRDVLRSMPAQSVHTCVTSPPYFGLRDYGNDGQIGLEPTPDEFVAALVAVFREVRRVLRDDGTVWLNLGDSYAQAKGHGHWESRNGKGDEAGQKVAQRWRDVDASDFGLKPKDLIGIPWMVAFALRADGWYLRSDIIWAKPNPMPESVTDRPTKAHEYLFLLSKGPRYYWDADAIREESPPHEQVRQDVRQRTAGDDLRRASSPQNGSPDHARPHGAGRNKRSVWTVATQPYPGAHFATFPPKLIEPCILAGAPERACSECGAPWVRVVEHGEVLSTGGSATGARASNMDAVSPLGQDPHSGAFNTGAFVQREHITKGFKPSCLHATSDAVRGDLHGTPDEWPERQPIAPAGSGTPHAHLGRGCPSEHKPGVVLDPLAGAGTTGVVALRHNRDFIGIELNAEYAELARWRIRDDAPLLNQAEVA